MISVREVLSRTVLPARLLDRIVDADGDDFERLWWRSSLGDRLVMLAEFVSVAQPPLIESVTDYVRGRVHTFGPNDFDTAPLEAVLDAVTAWCKAECGSESHERAIERLGAARHLALYSPSSTDFSWSRHDLSRAVDICAACAMAACGPVRHIGYLGAAILYAASARGPLDHPGDVDGICAAMRYERACAARLIRVTAPWSLVEAAIREHFPQEPAP